MKNEYGVTLDRNKYAPSIMQDYDRCFICYGNGEGILQRHEVFFGKAFREKSKMYGLWVQLCPGCHWELHNRKPELDRDLKKIAQIKAMDHYDWNVDEFRIRFGKNYV